MKLFLAGGEANISIIQKLRPPNVLLSYYYLTQQGAEISIKDWLKKVRVYKPCIFLDSGAFTAFTQKTQININKYAIYLQRNKDDVFVYCGLDAIGDAEQTFKNQLFLESKGLKPLYTFHVKEDFKYLKWAVERYDYIALGGMVPYAKDEEFLKKWLTQCFEIIKPEKTKIKVHGFGLTNFSLIKKFPFYSVDSTSWLSGARFAQCFFWDSRKLDMQIINVRDAAIKKYKSTIEKLGINFSQFLHGKFSYEGINTINMYAFLCAEKDINQYYFQKGWDFWNEIKIPEKTLENSQEKTQKTTISIRTIPERIEENILKKEIKVNSKGSPLTPQTQCPKQSEYKVGYGHPPLSTRGKIQEILKAHPEIEEKRKRNLEKALAGNLFGLKHGKYAKNLPLYCNDCYVKEKCPFSVFNPKSPNYNPNQGEEKAICALQPVFSKFFPKDFKIRDVRKIDELKERLIKIMLDRLMKQLWFEVLDGGIQDKAATHLAFKILDYLKEPATINIYENPAKIDKIEVDIFAPPCQDEKSEVSESTKNEKKQEENPGDALAKNENLCSARAQDKENGKGQTEGA